MTGKLYYGSWYVLYQSCFVALLHESCFIALLHHHHLDAGDGEEARGAGAGVGSRAEENSVP